MSHSLTMFIFYNKSVNPSKLNDHNYVSFKSFKRNVVPDQRHRLGKAASDLRLSLLYLTTKEMRNVKKKVKNLEKYKWKV